SSVERIKIEPQLHINNDWVIYPIEGRVMDATVPDGKSPSGNYPPVAVLRSYLCRPKQEDALLGSAAPSISGLRFRNAQQDLALAAKAPRAKLQELLGSCSSPVSADPEWYFRIRDYLFKLP